MTPDLPQTEIAIVEMTNAFRAKQELGAVRRSRQLDVIARRYARFLAESGRFSHTADGRQPADRATAGGYDYCQFAENLASLLDSRGFRTRQLAREAVTGWENSPGHRRNMLTPHSTEIGVGVAKTPGQSKFLAVQLFGRPAALRYRMRIRNVSGRHVRYKLGPDNQRLPSRTEVTHTLCQPAALTFPKAGLFSRNIASEFSVRNGDLFIVRRGSSGRIVVDHRPDVQ